MPFKFLSWFFSEKKAVVEKQTTEMRIKNIIKILNAIHNGTKIRFKILEPQEHGFIVKVWGVFGFIGYTSMPWKSINLQYWNAVASTVTGKYFSGVITKMSGRSSLFVYVSAVDHPLLKPKLVIGNRYSGIITGKKKYGFFVDIGFHFDWEFGSVIGLLHKSKLENASDISNYSLGDILTVIFCGYNDLEQMKFCINEFEAEWMLNYPQSLVGEKILVKVILNNDTGIKEFYALERFRSILLAPSEVFNEHQRKYISKRVNMLEHGDYIRCKVVEVSERKKCLSLYWHIENEAPKEELPISPAVKEKLDQLSEKFNTPHKKKKKT